MSFQGFKIPARQSDVLGNPSGALAWGMGCTWYCGGNHNCI